MNIGEEIFENINQINKQRFRKNCNLLDSNLELMKAIIHNKVLLTLIMARLGFENDEIDKINQEVYDLLDEEIRTK